MYTVWLQSQMSDLIILKKNPSFVKPFIENPKVIPGDMATQRTVYWEKHFGTVKEEFKAEFAVFLTTDEIKDLESLFHIRNMLAHAHVSVGRAYMLYRPAGGEKKEKALIEALDLKPIVNQGKPMMLKIEFWKDDVYLNAFNKIKRLDEFCFERLSKAIGVPHPRIR